MAVKGADARTDVGRPGSGRAVAYWGVGFVLLLLLSAGMVTVPGADQGVSFVRNFYETNRAVIVIAQVIGLAAAVVFLPFARALQRQDWVGRDPWVFAGGAAVTGAAVLAGVPPLALCVVARGAASSTISSLATASDLVDVVLFIAIAAFAASVNVAVHATWVRVLSAVVVLSSGLRAVLVLTGGETLELIAPLAFILLVLCLAVVGWRPRRRVHR
jgi:hypothetical protein